ncbi:hypothetical protein [Sporosarcina ureilytica]|uniref:ABC transporter periplasmic binding protein yphF n=1 Tax=Sporosarcina ureilytica TaxID=298596 RepID=A0A1D8JH83_9BACL|nr:hypothetical protein [Sporosarcina ureilytica]AOV08075.1 hypothetical protein BI350_11360 [Sporosarcina ureilytica]
MRVSLKKIAGVFFFSAILLLTGCMYPGEEEGQGKIPYPEHVESIQRAVDAYQKESGGLLPIKTKDAETDKYIKYPIEFSKIVPNYTEKIPSSAYEKGGIFQYVLMDVEENPTVKVVDLRAAEIIRDLNLRKSMNGQVPFKDKIGDNVYEIDFETLGFKSPLTLGSPYSDAHLPVVVGGDGNFYIDYSIDLNRILSEENPEIRAGEDIRFLLEEGSVVVPAYSLPYTVNENNEPIFMAK